LLALLAQQEVEIYIFKEKMAEKLGEESLIEIEDCAQQEVVNKYGAYTNYRAYSDALTGDDF
jgi:hypothetical protein